MKIFKKSKTTNFILLVVWLSLFSNFMNKEENAKEENIDHLKSSVTSVDSKKSNLLYFSEISNPSDFVAKEQDCERSEVFSNKSKNQKELLNERIYDSSRKGFNMATATVDKVSNSKRIVEENEIVSRADESTFQIFRNVSLLPSQDTLKYTFNAN